MANLDQDTTLLDDLKDQVSKGQVVVIIGAGVAAATTKGASTATWRGLIKHGFQRCLAVARPRVPDDWRKIVELEIAGSEAEHWLSAAEKIESRLRGTGGGEFTRWLKEATGSLEVKDSTVINALLNLHCQIATTNYDSLIEDVAKCSAVTWMDQAKFEQVIKGDAQGILHLHGHWEKPDSVIFGMSSYKRIANDPLAQHMQKTLRTVKCLLFVGFGAGLRDPNFGEFLKWSSIFSGSIYRCYRLARDDEVESIEEEHPQEERLYVLPYGKDHEDLAPFLESLRPKPTAAPPAPEAPTLTLLEGGPKRFLWKDLHKTIHDLHDLVWQNSEGASKYDFVAVGEIEEKNELNRLGPKYFELMKADYEPRFQAIEEFLGHPGNEADKNLFADVVDEIKQKVAAEPDGALRFETILVKLGDQIVSQADGRLSGKSGVVSCLLSYMYFKCDLGRKPSR